MLWHCCHHAGGPDLLDHDDTLVLDLVRRETVASIDCADWRAAYTTHFGERAGHQQRQATQKTVRIRNREGLIYRITAGPPRGLRAPRPRLCRALAPGRRDAGREVFSP